MKDPPHVTLTVVSHRHVEVPAFCKAVAKRDVELDKPEKPLHTRSILAEVQTLIRQLGLILKDWLLARFVWLDANIYKIVGR